MDLKDFIKDTVTQLSEAVSELNKQGTSIIVNPTNANGTGMINRSNGNSYKQTTLHFNIALTILDEGTAGGKVGVFAGWIGGTADAATKVQQQSVSSLDFNLDVLLPQG